MVSTQGVPFFFVRTPTIKNASGLLTSYKMACLSLIQTKHHSIRNGKRNFPFLISNGDRRGVVWWLVLTKNAPSEATWIQEPRVRSIQHGPWKQRQQKKDTKRSFFWITTGLYFITQRIVVICHTKKCTVQLELGVVWYILIRYSTSSMKQIRKYFIHKLYPTNKLLSSNCLSYSWARIRLIHNSIRVLNFDHHYVETYALRGSYTQILNFTTCFIRWQRE